MRTTGGHPFWVAGQGWVKASDLRPGMRLHSVSGSVDVDSAGPDNSAETYNLVVADYHTYFAGQEFALTHDNTIRRATNAILPGLRK
jgi:intein/homing endonuclease